MEVRNGKPWANPEGYVINATYSGEMKKEWRHCITQDNYHNLGEIDFTRYLHLDNPAEIIDKTTAALFRVRRKILHGYTVRDCVIAEWIGNQYRTDEIIVSQDRPNFEKHLVNNAYPWQYWERYEPDLNYTTIALFRVKTKGVHNG